MAAGLSLALALTCLLAIWLAWSSVHVSRRPTPGFAVYCAFLKHFATHPRPIPLWHGAWDTWTVFSYTPLSTCWKGIFVCLFFLLFLNLLCDIGISSPLFKEHHQVSGFTPTHTPTHLVLTHTHTHTQRKEPAEHCVRSTTESCFLLLCCLMTVKPDAAFSHCTQTWSETSPRHIVTTLWQQRHNVPPLKCWEFDPTGHRKSVSETVEECNHLSSLQRPASLKEAKWLLVNCFLIYFFSIVRSSPSHAALMLLSLPKSQVP